MSRVDDIRQIIQEFNWGNYGLDEAGTTLAWNEEWSTDLAQAIADGVSLSSCDCNRSPVYPPLWKVEE